MKKVLVLNGPNINMLGLREENIYGKGTYNDLIDMIKEEGDILGIPLEFFQSNHEGVIIDEIQKHLNEVGGIIINPAAYTHTSIGILDALKLHKNIPIVEVHISDIEGREDFRKVSFTSLACKKQIVGKGFEGYVMALRYINNCYLKEKL